MSTFTNGSCCSGGGSSAIDIKIASLIAQVSALNDALTTLSNTVNTHTASTVTSLDVHGVNTKYSDVLTSIVSINNSISNILSNKQDNMTAVHTLTEDGTGYYNTPKSIKDAIDAINTTVADKQDSLVAFDNADNYDSWQNYHSDSFVTPAGIKEALDNQINLLATRLDTIDSYLSDDGVITSLQHTLYALINVRQTIDFTNIDKTTAVPITIDGVKYYIFAELSNDWSQSSFAPADNNKMKAGTIYVKYQDTDGFDAVIDATVSRTSEGLSGALTATVSKAAGTWAGLSFSILGSTSATGTSVAYLAFTCDNTFASGTDLYVWGIDYKPVTSTSIQLSVALITTAEMSTDSAAATLMSDLVVSNMDFTERPTYNGDALASVADMKGLLPLGSMVMWWSEQVAVPAGWSACDGKTVTQATQTTEQADALKVALGNSDNLPIADNTIMLCYYVIS